MDDVRTLRAIKETAEGRFRRRLRAEEATTMSAEGQAWLLEHRDAIAAWNRWDDENELFTDQFSPLR